MKDKSFELFDLRVDVVAGDKPMICNHPEGSFFLVEGENLVFPENNHFPMYPLAALLPFFPAKQRVTDEDDWMTTDAEIACPDPHCGGRFRISRTGRRTFKHAETSGLPSAHSTPYWQKDHTND